MSDTDRAVTSDESVAALPTRVLMVSGTRVSLQRAGFDDKVAATILGSVPGFYIVLRDAHDGPTGRGLRSLSPLIGDVVILRFLYEGVAYGFRSAVSRLATDPEALLFIDYPTAVEQASVRQVPRIVCRLPCDVLSGHRTSQAGLLLDINATGCAVAGALQGADDPPHESDPMTLNLTLPGHSSPWQGTGHIRRISVNGRIWRAGITFDAEQAELVCMLESYLMLAPIG